MPFECTSAQRWNWTRFLLSSFEKVRVTEIETLSNMFEVMEGFVRARSQKYLPLRTVLRGNNQSRSVPFICLSGSVPAGFQSHHSFLHCLSIICCLALGLWYLKEDTKQALRFCLNFLALASVFFLLFALETSYTMGRFACTLEVITESLESLVINKDSQKQTSGRNFNWMKYQLRGYLGVLLRLSLCLAFKNT